MCEATFDLTRLLTVRSVIEKISFNLDMIYKKKKISLKLCDVYYH